MIIQCSESLAESRDCTHSITFLLLKSQDLISDKNDPFREKNLKRNTEIIFTEKNVVAHCTAVIDPLNKHINNKYMTIDYIAHYRGS